MSIQERRISTPSSAEGKDEDRRNHGGLLELSLIVPTFNEVLNIDELVGRVETALAGVEWEIVFVDDDSPDGTAEAVRALARRERRIRCIQRIGRRGLSSACVEGMLASAGRFVAVMDADLQHDERILPQMLEIMRGGTTDVVVGSRYFPGGGTGDWSKTREKISRFATNLGRMVLRVDLSDPMSGFFMLRREVMNVSVRRISSIGFKILLDILASSPHPLHVQELPYEFRNRFAGESKLDSLVAWEFIVLVLDKLFGRFIPVRFITFCLVGGLGVFVHLFVVAVLFRWMNVEFIQAQAVAVVVAMTSNFFLNNLLTYRDRRLRGWGVLRGWISFVVACSVGAMANVGVAGYLFVSHADWLVSALAGIVIGTVWNYAVTATYTWSKSR